MKIVQAVHFGSGGSADGFGIVRSWSERDPEEFDVDHLSKLWASLTEAGAGGKRVKLGTLFSVAKEHGFKRPSTADHQITDSSKSGSRVAHTICLADVEAKPVSWAWEGRIAKGAVNVAFGEPGQGKSQISCDIAARLSTGRQFPYEEKLPRREPQRVLILNAEDALDSVIKPRLIAARANLDMIEAIPSVLKYDKDGKPVEAEFSLKEDIATIDRLIEERGDVALVIFDPMSAYLGKTDSHNNSDVRSLLAPLARVAEKYNVAFLCITHVNKASDQNALNRITGSGAFGAAARSVLGIGPNIDHSGAPIDGERVLISVKSNLGKPPEALVYKIEQKIVAEGGKLIETSCVKWIDARSDLDANAVVNADTGKKKRSQLDQAVDWLKEYVGSGISNFPATQVLAAGEANGHAPRTLQRAREIVGVDVRKDGKGGWRWCYGA
jgi:putative DNA primase/helicase